MTVAGLERVIEGEGSFAYLMEEPSIEYVVERQCDLMQVGGSVGSSNYAIALRKGIYEHTLLMIQISVLYTARCEVRPKAIDLC